MDGHAFTKAFRVRLALRRLFACGVAAGLVLLCVQATPALASSPFSWSSPVRIDNTAPFSSPSNLTAVACPPSGTLCVETDNGGDVITSSQPTAPNPGWTVARVDGRSVIDGVSCPTDTLCVAVDAFGQVLTSQNPTAGPSAWLQDKVDGNATLNGISCPATNLCVAVDKLGDVVTSTNPLGGPGAWSVTTVPGANAMTGVSCPTTTLCVAVDKTGQVITSSNPTNSGSWHVTSIDPVQVPNLSAVSCSSATLCVAVGSGGMAVTSTDPTAGSAAWSPADIDAALSLSAVSCNSTLCAATDKNGNVVVSKDPTNSASWTKTKADGTNELHGIACPSGANWCIADDAVGMSLLSSNPGSATPTWTATQVDGNNIIRAVSCPSDGLCVAVDGSGNVLWSTNPTAQVENWASATIDNGQSLNGVSCPSLGFCIAVDNAGNMLSSTNPTGGAGAWQLLNVDGSHVLHSVSCPSPVFCAASDDAGQVLASKNPGSNAASDWTITSISGGASVNSISCPGGSLCVAVDSAGDVLTSSNPGSSTPTWSLANVDASRQLSGVSCPTLNLCVAIDNSGNAIHSTNPAAGAWTQPVLIDSGNVPTSISCPRETLCLAVDLAGNVMTSTNPTGGGGAWTTTTIDGGTTLFGASCPSLSFCVAVDGSSSALIASPFIPPANLTVTVTGAAKGAVTGTGINCAPTCTANYISGTVVTLTATPGPGAAFAGWSGACSGTDPCTVTMNADQNVTALFVPLYTLNVSLAGAGSGRVVATGIDCPGRCSAGYASGTKVALSASPAPGSTFVGWSGFSNCTGTRPCVLPMDANHSVTATFAVGLPANTASPAISGTTLPGHTIACSNGTWTNNPTSFTYQWRSNSKPITGATAQTYSVRNVDEGHTLTCAVTASNRGGKGQPATSPGATVALPGTLDCQRPTGALSGKRLGALALGYSRVQARNALGKHRLTYNLFDDFCLYGGWGIRVAYPTGQLLHAVPATMRKNVIGRVVLALTSNAYYALRGDRPGDAIGPAARRLHARNHFRVGRNVWYFAPGRVTTGVMKVRHGVVVEVGIATRALTLTRQQQLRFILSFPRAFY